MVLAAIRMTPTGPRNGHETSIKPVLELNFPRVDARDYHWFIQQVCQQGGEEGKQRKPDLKSQREAARKPKKKPDTQQAKNSKEHALNIADGPGTLTLTPSGPKETGTVHR